MWLKLGALLAAIIGYCSVIFYARRDARKAEQVANLRRELKRNVKEQERYNAISNNVNNKSDDDVANILQNLSNNKR